MDVHTNDEDNDEKDTVQIADARLDNIMVASRRARPTPAAGSNTSQVSTTRVHLIAPGQRLDGGTGTLCLDDYCLNRQYVYTCMYTCMCARAVYL